MSVSDSPLLSDATTEAITEQDENRQPECLLSRTPLTEIDIPHTLILPMPMQHLIGFHTPSAIMHFGQTIQGTLNNKSRSHRVSMNWMICPRMMTFHQQSNFLLQLYGQNSVQHSNQNQPSQISYPEKYNQTTPVMLKDKPNCSFDCDYRYSTEPYDRGIIPRFPISVSYIMSKIHYNRVHGYFMSIADGTITITRYPTKVSGGET